MKIKNCKLVDLNKYETKARRLFWDFVEGISVDASDEVRGELSKFCISYFRGCDDIRFETAEDLILMRLLRIEKDCIESISKILEKEAKEK